MRLIFKCAIALVTLSGVAAGVQYFVGYPDGTTASRLEDNQASTIPLAPRTNPHRGCIFRGGAAAICTTGTAAVLAYQRYGTDPEMMKQSYAQAVLARAGCYVATNVGPPIKQLSHGRVALSDGWVGVTMVSIGPGGGAVADDYIDGRCEDYVPETYSLE